MTLPSIYIPGAQKSGTTTLASLLSQAEGVNLYSQKEPMIMSDGDIRVHLERYTRSRPALPAGRRLNTDEIERAYASLVDSTGSRYVDASTSYFWSALARHRIQELTPSADIIFVLRDPVERFESALRHHWAVGRVPDAAFRHAADARLDLLTMGHYLEAVTLWMAELPEARFHFVEFDHLVAQPREQILEIWRALDLAPAERVEVRPENVSGVPASAAAHRMLTYATQLFGLRLGPQHFGEPPHSRRSRAAEQLRRANFGLGRKMGRQSNLHMSSSDRSMLRAHYSEVNAGLDALTGARFESTWFG